jgi:hypothetical protein
MLSYHDALTVNQFHHASAKNADGTPLRARRNGKTKTWKTRPGHFKIPVKSGLYWYFYITHEDAADWSAE